jgi:hypothetical protein
MQTLYLDIKDSRGIHNNAVMALDNVSKPLFVISLNL